LAGIKKAVTCFEKKEMDETNKKAEEISGVSKKTAKRAQGIKPRIKNSYNMQSQKRENVIIVLEIVPGMPEE
jgi:hypothetical protein